MRTTENKWTIIASAALILVVMLSCTGQNGRQSPVNGVDLEHAQDPSNQALISFDTLIHNFGTIIEGEMVVCYFDYQNTGEADLLIHSVEASCGCTTPDWNRSPLSPGERESLKVVFDATGRSGSQHKVITVMTNASNSSIRLTLKANINNSV